MMSENFAADQLQLHVEAIEKLEAEKAEKAEDIKERYSLAKAEGFDTKIMREIIAMRKLDDEQRQKAEAVLATYMAALNMPSGFDL